MRLLRNETAATAVGFGILVCSAQRGAPGRLINGHRYRKHTRDSILQHSLG